MKGYIRKRGENKWQIEIDIGRSSEGKRMKKTETIQGTKKEAQVRMTEIIHQINNNTFIMPEKMTVKDFFEYWDSMYIETNLAKNTRENYLININKHIVPKLGTISLQKLLPIHLQEYYSSKLKSGRIDGKGGLSAKTVLYQHRIIKEALNHAVKWKLISTNPADAVEPPKPQKFKANFLNEKQVEQLLNAVENTEYEIPVILAVLLGTRRGEALGLKFSDIDFKLGTITICRELLKISRDILFKDGTKNENESARIVQAPEIAIKKLKQQKKIIAKQKLLLGKSYQDNDLVCCKEDGQPIDPSTFSNAFGKFLKRNKLPDIRFHDLRHTNASLMLQLNIPMKVASERLGHSSIKMTMDLYSHVMPRMQQEAADKLNTLFSKR